MSRAGASLRPHAVANAKQDDLVLNGGHCKLPTFAVGRLYVYVGYIAFDTSTSTHAAC